MKLASAFVATAGFLAAAGSGQAASYYWDPSTTLAPGTTGVGANGLGSTTATLTAGNWNTSSFWTLIPTSTTASDYTPWSSVPAASDVIFSAGTGILNIAPGTVTLNAATSVNSLNIQAGHWTFAGTGSPVLTIGAGGLSLTAAGGGNLTASVGGDTTFNNTLSLLLNGAQTWTNNAFNATNNIAVAGGVAGNATSGTNILTLAGNANGSGFKLSGVVSDGGLGGKLGITVNSAAAATNTSNQLSGLANTFTGKVTVTSGGLAVNFLANAGTNSSLGAGTGSDSIIDLGGGTTTGGLILGSTSSGTATTSISNRVINLAGTTGGGAIRNNATSAAVTLTLSGGVTNAGGGNKTLTLGGTNLGANTISGVIADATADSSKTSLSKVEAGLWTLTGTNTYSGGTSITGGTLAVSATGNLGLDIAGNNITVNGGNLLLNAASNVGLNQTITVTSGGIGVAYDPAGGTPPAVVGNTLGTNGVYGINYTGTGGVTSLSTLYNGTVFLGSFTSGTFNGSSLDAGSGSTYRLGGGGGTLTIPNAVLTGANAVLAGGTGGGTVVLSSTSNDFTGKTTIQNGVVSVASLQNVGAGNSSLGNPTTVANGTIDLGSGTNAAGLTYSGTGGSTDRVLNFAGTTGSITLGNNGTGAISYTSAPTFTGNGVKTIILGNATDTVGGTIGNITNSTAATNLTKNGLTNSLWTLTGGAGNTFTGTTTILGGILQTAAASDLATSFVFLNAPGGTQLGVWQTQGSITRTISTTVNAANLNWAANNGFAAKGGAVNLNFGSGQALTWGTGGFMGAGAAPMVFGSPTADNVVTLQNNFTLGDNVSSGFNRVIEVDPGLGGDSAKLTGVISQGGGTSALNGVTKQGNGTLVLSGNNTYTGSTLVTAGTLIVNGSHITGNGYTVNVGATLGGIGTIAPTGVTTVVVNGTLAPGDSTVALPSGQTGTLTINSTGVNFGNGSSFAVQIGGPTAGAFDQLALTNTGAANISLTGTVTLNLTWVGTSAPVSTDTYEIVNRAGAGTWGAFFANASEGSIVNFTNGYQGVITYIGGDGNDIVVSNIVAVPESKNVALGVMGVLGMIIFMRNRRRSHAA